MTIEEYNYFHNWAKQYYNVIEYECNRFAIYEKDEKDEKNVYDKNTLFDSTFTISGGGVVKYFSVPFIIKNNEKFDFLSYFDADDEQKEFRYEIKDVKLNDLIDCIKNHNLYKKLTKNYLKKMKFEDDFK